MKLSHQFLNQSKLGFEIATCTWTVTSNCPKSYVASTVDVWRENAGICWKMHSSCFHWRQVGLNRPVHSPSSLMSCPVELHDELLKLPPITYYWTGIGPLISRWELDKFKNCWNKSFRTFKILTLLYQQLSNFLISQRDMSSPRLGALSKNLWSGVTNGVPYRVLKP